MSARGLTLRCAELIVWWDRSWVRLGSCPKSIPVGTIDFPVTTTAYPSYVELEISLFLLRRLLGVKTEDKKQTKVSKLVKNELLLINIGSTSTGGRVLSVKADLAKIQLTSPACTEVGEKVALSRRIEKHWRLVGEFGYPLILDLAYVSPPLNRLGECTKRYHIRSRLMYMGFVSIASHLRGPFRYSRTARYIRHFIWQLHLSHTLTTTCASWISEQLKFSPHSAETDQLERKRCLQEKVCGFVGTFYFVALEVK